MLVIMGFHRFTQSLCASIRNKCLFFLVRKACHRFKMRLLTLSLPSLILYSFILSVCLLWLFFSIGENFYLFEYGIQTQISLYSIFSVVSFG